MQAGAEAPRMSPLTFGLTGRPGGGGGVAGCAAGGAAPGFGGVPAYTLRASNTPSLFASRRTVMLFVAGELTNRSPFGAYTIMRGARISAYTLTVKPAGAPGIALAGLSTSMPRFGRGALTAGSRSACGCGGPDDRCAKTPPHIPRKPMTRRTGFRVANFMTSLLRG